MNFAGLDIGGANIKFASLDGDAVEIPFPFWLQRDELVDRLSVIADRINSPTCLGVTMTAELADCFANKREGVEFIVDAVELVFASMSSPRYYQTDGKMVDAVSARQNWALTAASNWHASAWYLFDHHDLSSGIMMDVGSTTTDIVPVHEGKPVDPAQTDFDRLANGQLVYAGVGRTSICSLVADVKLKKQTVMVARERFGTMQDVLVWLDEIEENSESTDTADGRPLTRQLSRARLARTVCADSDDLDDASIDAIAMSVRTAYFELVLTNLKRVFDENPNIEPTFCIVGCGVDLAMRIINLLRETHDDPTGRLSDESGRIVRSKIGPLWNQVIPALAVAEKRKRLFASDGLVK